MNAISEKSKLVVTDTGPLIALAVSKYLHLLALFFEEVLIPESVMQELCLGSDRSGSAALKKELEKNAVFRVMSAKSVNPSFAEILDAGEAEALALAKEHAGVLLIDERRGRKIAIRNDIAIIGTGRLFVAAKKRGMIHSVREALKQLRSVGYRLSDALCEELIRLAGE
jgi:uncharacterized protein